MWLIARTDYVKKELTNITTTILSEQLKTTVSIGNINYNLFKRFTINDVLIKDNKNDTLAYLKQLKVNIQSFNLASQRINIRKINITNPYANIYNISNDSMNYANVFIKKKKKHKAQKTTWKIDCKKLNIINGKVKYTQWQKQSNVFDNINMLFTNIYADSSDIEITNTGGEINLNGQTFVKHTGLQLSVKNKRCLVDYLNITMDNSTINLNQSTINLNDSSKFKNAKINLSSIQLMPNDFAIFSKQLAKIDNFINCSGTIFIDTSNISAKKLNLIFGKQSYLNANLNLKNYKTVDKMKYNINFKDLFVTHTDLSEISDRFNRLDTSQLAEYLNKIHQLQYTGILKGTADSLFSNGKITSNIGVISTKISASQKNDKIHLNGNLQTLPIQLNKLLRTQNFGKLNLNLTTQGTYCKKQGFDLALDGNINNIEINDTQIDSIEVKGQLKENIFKGFIHSQDYRLNFDFKGSLNLNDLSYFNFESNVYNTDFCALGINKKDSISKLSVNINADFTQVETKSYNGYVKLKYLKYQQNKNYFINDSLNIIANNNEANKTLELQSDFIDAKLNGNHDIKAIINDYRTLAHTILPSVFDEPKLLRNTKSNNFNFNVLIREVDTITDVIIPKLKVAPLTTIQGTYNSKDSTFSMDCKSDFIAFGKKNIKNLKLNTHNTNKALYVNIKSKAFKYLGKQSLKNFQADFEIQHDTIINQTTWDNKHKTKLYSGNVSTTTVLQSTDSLHKANFTINVKPSQITIADTTLNIHQCNIIKDSSGITFDDVKIQNEYSHLFADGKISHNKQDSLIVSVDNMNIYYLNVLLQLKGTKLGGIISGKTKIKDLYGERIINSNLKVKSFSLNKKLIGDTYIKSYWQPQTKRLNLIGNTTQNADNIFTFDGFWATKNKELVINFDFIKVPINILEVFLAPNLYDIKGYVSGKVSLFNRNKTFSWEGAGLAHNASMKVKATNVSYYFNDSVFLTQSKILLKDITLYDKYKNTAKLNGLVEHKNFKNFKYNFFINSNQILGINTTPLISPIYYGKAFAKGDVSIKGYKTSIEINIAATTLEKSKFAIAIQNRSELKRNDFITFVSKKKKTTNTNINPKTEKIKFQTYINFNLRVTPKAEIKMIFDPTVGDELKAKGNANLNMAMTPNSFDMYGNYIIDDGSFSFTMQDVITKRLRIKQGSSVNWTGDPINANLNIDAVYEVKRASIYDLTGIPEDKDKSVPVNCHLLMTKSLYNPTINFSIEPLSNSHNEILQQINSLESDEINKQIISLLMLNKFTPINNLANNPNANNSSSFGATTVSELLSGQLNQWISQLNNTIDVNVRVKPKTESTEAEYGVALSKKLWNDRVNLYGNFEYGGNNINSKNSPYSTDFYIELKLTEKGNLRLRAFQQTNDDIDNLNTSAYKQGVGIFYTKEFNTFTELMRQIFRKQYATKPKKVKLEDNNKNNTKN